MFKFAQHGQVGAWVSELLPHTAKIVDDIAIVKIDAHRGDQPRSGDHVLSRPVAAAGRPRMGAWVSYGLGSENEDLPAFVVMISQAQR